MLDTHLYFLVLKILLTKGTTKVTKFMKTMLPILLHGDSRSTKKSRKVALNLTCLYLIEEWALQKNTIGEKFRLNFGI